MIGYQTINRTANFNKDTYQIQFYYIDFGIYVIVIL